MSCMITLREPSRIAARLKGMLFRGVMGFIILSLLGLWSSWRLWRFSFSVLPCNDVLLCWKGCAFALQSLYFRSDYHNRGDTITSALPTALQAMYSRTWSLAVLPVGICGSLNIQVLQVTALEHACTVCPFSRRSTRVQVPSPPVWRCWYLGGQSAMSCSMRQMVSCVVRVVLFKGFIRTEQ